MEEQGNQDNLNSSLTDLMTSLMVIFVLLLLVFMKRTAGKDAAATHELLKALQADLIPQGFSEKNIKEDKKDPNAILVIVPENLMNFESGESRLQPNGEKFLKDHIPRMAAILCAAQYRPNIESVIVEGHTDEHGWRGASQKESQNNNLKLSQDRSMEVVKKSLDSLNEEMRGCLLNELSASGRGEQDPESTPEESRRVIFRIRVRASQSNTILRAIAP